MSRMKVSEKGVCSVSTYTMTVRISLSLGFDSGVCVAVQAVRESQKALYWPRPVC